MIAPPAIEAAGSPRPQRPPRLICLDLDGTCVDSARQFLHPRTEAAVRSAARHLAVVIATGRMYCSASPWAERLGVTAPLICYQGALIRRPPNHGIDGEVIEHLPVAVDTARDALTLARRRGWHRQAYIDDRLLCEQDRPEAHEYADIAQVPIELVDDLEPLLSAGSTKFICVIDDHAEARRAEAELTERLGSAARVTGSLPQFVEITDPRAGKGHALARVAQLLGIDLAEVLAIGDAPNDVDMFNVAGFAVIVRGAREQALAAAAVSCAGPADGGVADVLELLGLV